MNEQDRERYIKLILLSDNLMAIKKYEKKLEIEYQNMVDEMMPEIWENFANDVKMGNPMRIFIKDAIYAKATLWKMSGKR